MRYLLALLVPFSVYAADLTGRIVSIVDGDTLILIDSTRQQHEIHLAGIDAPEAYQPFGQKSRSNLSAIVFNREVEVVGDKKDRYDRIVAKVMAADPDCNAPACPKVHDVGLMQVMSDMAWWYRQYANKQTPKDREDYEVAEFNAKIRRLGLWADKNPMPPWEWRHFK